MLNLFTAARSAREFIESARAGNGMYRLPEWPEVPPGRGKAAGASSRTVAILRFVQRLTVGFLDPIEDALYLTVALRTLGVPASFHLGREITPLTAPAGLYAWVQRGAEIISTSLPVREEYLQIHAAPAGAPAC